MRLCLSELELTGKPNTNTEGQSLYVLAPPAPPCPAQGTCADADMQAVSYNVTTWPKVPDSWPICMHVKLMSTASIKKG